ncbi:MAG: biotin/lipoyl-binding protein, partial [Gemmatimonadota bacterium]|nr:biotin/lipoyl-binding protein [Gemmatimonadota bacterium]
MQSGSVSPERLGAVVLCLLAAGACSSEVVEQPEVPRPVKSQVFGQSGFGSGVEYSGVVQAARDAELSFEVPGLIIAFPVVEGQRVGRGTLLARLDSRDYEAQRDAVGA